LKKSQINKKSKKMKKITEYLFGTVLPCFVRNGIKKYATLVMTYLKRSFEEKTTFLTKSQCL
jgi:hypothetical protein